MATYSANISVKVVGLTDLTKLESRVEKLQSRFTELNDAAAKVAAPFKGHIEALEKLNTLLLANERLLKNQGQAIDRMERAGRTSGGATARRTDPKVLQEQQDAWRRQILQLKERADLLGKNKDITDKLRSATEQLISSSTGNIRLGKELIANAKTLLNAEERLAKQKADAASRAISDARAESIARLRAVEEVQKAEEKLQQSRRAYEKTQSDQARASLAAAAAARAEAAQKLQTDAASKREFGNAQSEKARANLKAAAESQAELTRLAKEEAQARQTSAAALDASRRAFEQAQSEQARANLKAAADARRNPTKEVLRRPIGGAVPYPNGAGPASSPTAVEGSVVNLIRSRAQLEKQLIDNVQSYRKRVKVIENNAEIDKITQQLNAELSAIETAFNARVKADNKWWALQEKRLRQMPDVRGPEARKRNKQAAAEAQKALGTKLESMALGVGFPLMFGAGPASILGSFAGSFAGKGFGGQILGGALLAPIDQLGMAAINTAKSLRYPIESFEALKTAGMFANREQEQLVKRLIELGQVSKAAEIIQSQVDGKIGGLRTQDMLDLDESTVRLSKAMAELNLQMQALLAGPLGLVIARLADIAGNASAPIRAGVLSDELRNAGKGTAASKLSADVQRIQLSPQAKLGLDPGWVRQQMEAAIAEAQKALPPPAAAPRLTPEDRLKEAEAALATAERAEALRRQGLQLERQQSDLRMQIEDQVYGLRRRAADLERANADLRRSVEDEIFRKRQELAKIESDNAREQARLATERLDLQLSGFQADGNTPGADIANGLLSAVRQYVKTRAEAEADFQQKERNFRIEMVDLERSGEKYRFEVNRKVADLRRQSEEFSRDVTRARIGAERAIYDLQIQAADYALAKTKERIALEEKAAQQIQLAQQATGQVQSMGGVYWQGGVGPKGPNHYGPHFDIKRNDGGYYPRNALDRYVSVNGRPLSTGVTVPGGEYGAPRSYGGHAGWDYAFSGKAGLSLQNGAKWLSNSRGSYGDATAFMTPDGQVYKIIHGTFEPGAGPLPQTPTAAAAVASVPRPQVDTTAAVSGLNLTAPAITGLGDLLATGAALDTNIAKAKQLGLELAKAFEGLTKEQAAQALTQQFATAIEQLNAPMEQLLRAQGDQLAYQREYAGLIANGVTPELAEQLTKIREQVTAQLQQLDVAIALQEALKGQLEAAGKWTEELQAQLDLLVAQRDVIQGKGKRAEANAVAAKSPEQRLNDAFTAAQGELNRLQDPVNQIIAGANSIGEAFSSSFQGIATGSMTAREALANFFTSTGEHFVQMASRMIAKALVMKALGILGGGLSGGTGLGGGGATSAIGKGFLGAMTGGGMGLSGATTAATGGFGFNPGAMLGGFTTFATGGYVNSPTSALIGESEPEYVIPQSKMSEAMHRYSAGGRGSGVIPSTGDGGEGGSENGGSVEIGYRVTEINSVRYVSEEEFRAGMREAAKQGAAGGHRKVFQDLKNSRSQRSRAGIS